MTRGAVMSHATSDDFNSFWRIYAAAHAQGPARVVHLVGSTGALACLALGAVGKRRWLLLLGPVLGWGSACLACWLGDHPELAWRRPTWMLRASARLYLQRLGLQSVDEQPAGGADAPAAGQAPAPKQSGSNGKSHRIQVELPIPAVDPVDPSTLN